MFPNPDTYYAVISAERTSMLKRAEHRALLLEAAKQPPSAAAGASRAAATEHLSRRVAAIRSLCQVLRPARA